ncbi:MAG: Thioredoxin domain protein [Paenibacillaceae bacterium]|jgi:thioredoxin 1|nr:Thioredoxin domain protein [Paenibacillaceae bacterium]
MSVQKVNDHTLLQSVKRGGTVLVDFGALWCAPCRRLEPILEELDRQWDGKVPIFQVNVDESPESAAAYGVMSMPTVIVFKDGQPVRKLVGLRPAEVYRQAAAE